MKTYTKESLIKELKKIKKTGWIENARPGNSGGIGNTIEDLLGIEENNLPLPNAADWELKCQRMSGTSLTTLLHTEPSPIAFKFVPRILLPKYGWPHELAGDKYPPKEMSFRQTINCLSRSDRGFKVVVDKDARKVLISFDASAVSHRHKSWLNKVKRKAGLGELNPQPYWGFDDIFAKVAKKLRNCFFIIAKVKHENEKEYFSYEKMYMLQRFTIDKFISAMEKGIILVDFDARTGHNHGTKFRMRKEMLPEFYEVAQEIV